MSNLAQQPFYQDRPAIYVGTYAAYNNGSLRGKWFYLNHYLNIDEFYADIKSWHHEESDPEFMFQDWQDIPDELISESYLNPCVWDYLELDDDQQIAFDWLTNDHGLDAEEALSKVDDVQLYHGSLVDYIEDYYSGLGTVPTEFESYIDWAALARDWVYESQIDDVMSSHNFTQYGYYDLVQDSSVTWVVNAWEF